MPDLQVISFKVSIAVAKRLEAIAANKGGLSKVIREAIGQVITKYIPPEELKEIMR